MDNIPQQVEIKKNKDWSFVIRLVLSMVLCVFFVSIVLQSYYIPIGLPSLIVMSVLATLLFSFLLKTNCLILVTVIAVFAGLFTVLLIFLASLTFRTSLSRYMEWLQEHINGNFTAHSQFSSITAIWITLVASALCYIVFVRLRSFFIPFVISFVSLILVGIYKPNTPTATILTISFYTVLFCLLSVYNTLKKSRIGSDKEGTAFIFFISVIGIIAMMASTFLPKNNHPVQIRWLDELYNRIYYATTTINQDNNDLFYFAYHIKSDHLDGYAYPDDLKVMTVMANKSEYLKYSIKDKYTGFSWVDTDKTRTPMVNLENEVRKAQIEFENGIRYLNPGTIRTTDFTYMNEMAVRFERIKADFLFTPAYLNSVEPESGILSVNSGGIVFLNEQRRKGFTYEQGSRSINYGHPSFIALLRNSEKGLYESYFPDEPDETHDMLRQRAHDIQQTYLHIPASLPDRVKDLAKSLSESSNNNYDRVKSIENFLATEMNYTLQPMQRPFNRDLVDFFLFDSNEGYCTSYASAMTMLVRSLGIPARYCEGYVMPHSSGDPPTYIVTNRQAHAWCEVYFEGFGWVPFEPTSAYHQVFYANAAHTPEQPLPDEVPDESEGMIEDSSAEISVEDPAAGDDDEQFISPSPLAPEEIPNSIDSPSILFLQGILIIFILLLLIVVVRAVHNHKKMRKMLINAQYGDPAKGIILLYRYYLACLGVLNVKRHDYETPYEYYNRIKEESTFLKNFDYATEAFVEARYNAQASLAPLQKDVYLYNNEFQKFLREHLNAMEYAYYHYFKGIV
jgi:transglutaminase-like putative cysteine protease